ncbi:MAG: hypothetical protein IKH23_04125 [Clostridiales bacterium]|nr:hypothetical protein [Clostridiales bacterium]
MKRIKMTALILAAGILLPAFSACTPKAAEIEGPQKISIGFGVTSETSQTSESSSESEVTDTTLDLTGKVTFSGDSQKYANTFITNFAEQYFYTKFIFTYDENPGKFDVQNAKVEDILCFVCLHMYLNDNSGLISKDKGGCRYVTFTYDKAAEVAGRYFNYRLKKEDCKKLSAPPKTNKNKVYGPFYEDNKIWLVMDDDTVFKDIAVVDYAENNDDGTMTLYFTIYCIDHELVQKMSFNDIKKYYSLSPAEAKKDKTINRRETGIANVSVTQSGKYLLNTYETILDPVN